MPKYDLPDAEDGSKQWMELKDREQITRKELRATRLAYDVDGGFVEKTEAHTERVLSYCLVNWEIKSHSNDALRLPQNGNVKQVQDYTATIPLDVWLAIEKAINGEDGEGGYTRECLNAKDADPQKPSTA